MVLYVPTALLIFFFRKANGIQGVGFASMLVPLYTAECAPPKIRGRLVGIYEIGVQVGTCMGFWINLGVDQNMAPTSAQWITPFALQLIPAGLLLIGLLFMTDSPRWMAKAYGRTRATETLARLRDLPIDHLAIQEEVDDILLQLELERHDGFGNSRAKWKELLRPGMRNRVLLGVVIMIFFQMCGSNAINYYSPRIFESIGLVGTEAALISTGIYGIVRLVAVFVAMYFVVDRFGRKSMLIGGSVVIVSCSTSRVLILMDSTNLIYRQSRCGSSESSSRSRAPTPTPANPSAQVPTQRQSSSSCLPWPSASAGPVCPGSSAPRYIPCGFEDSASVSASLRTGSSISSLRGAYRI